MAIVGAGLAGTATAQTLSAAGIECHLFDPEPASGASGNAQGMLYVAPQIDPTPASRFWLQAFDLACEMYSGRPEFHASGLLCLAEDEAHEVRLRRIYDRLGRSAEDLAWVDAAEASTIAQISLLRGGLYWPKSGWMAVRDFVLRPIDGVVHRAERVDQINEADEKIRVNQDIFDLVILCNAYSARQFLPDYLSPKPVRGQISRVKGQAPQTAVCAEGYLTPADSLGWASFGASFVPNDADTTLRAEDDCFNQKLMTQLTGQQLNGQIGPSRASIRCASPDYLPMVGALPKAKIWIDELSKLRTDAKWKPERAMSAYRRVMVNIGHGSRGLTSTPLAARILLQQINGQEVPADDDIPSHVNPARFLIRALKRNQI